MHYYFCVRGHFTVACYVTWPTKSSEARGDLALIQTSLPFSCKLVSIRTTLHNKPREVCIKARSPPPSLPFEGQLTQQTTVKWSFHSINVVFFFPQRFLGDYSDGLFHDAAALEAILRFQGKLNEISMAIKERNKGLEVPYEYLLPERTPNSIAI